MEQNDNTPLAGNDFVGNLGVGDVDSSLLQAFLENGDGDNERPNHAAVEDINLIANPVIRTSAQDQGSADNQSRADDAFERAGVDVIEADGLNTEDDDLFGDGDLGEIIVGDEEATGAPTLLIEQQPSLNPQALALPPAASQQHMEASREPAYSGHAVVEQDDDGPAAPQDKGSPVFEFDFNADPSNPGFDLNDLLPLEDDDLPKTEAELLAFAAQNANRTVNQNAAEFGVPLPEDAAAQQAVVDNVQAVLKMTDEQLAELLQADLINLPPLHGDQKVDNTLSAVVSEQAPATSQPLANSMDNGQPVPANLPDVQNCRINPGVMPDNTFLQINNATVGGRLPSKGSPPTHVSKGTDMGPSSSDPARHADIPASSYSRRRSRDEFQNDGYFAPQPSEPLAKKPKQQSEQVSRTGRPNRSLPTLNLPQQSVGVNASSDQPAVPALGPVSLPPRQAAEAQRPVGNQFQQPPVQSPMPPPVLLPVVHSGYQPLPVKDRNWLVGPRGRHIFQYTDKGEWVYGQVYTADQLKNFICGEYRDGHAPSRSRLTIWIQSTLNGHKNRYPQAVKCRWTDCPVKQRTITQGQYRVCFDEHPDTSGRTTDPFHNTGYMHLYCFEQCASLVSLIKNPPGMVRVQPDDRRFSNIKENGNPMQLGGSSAAHSRHFIDAYNAWVEHAWRKWQTRQMSRQDTLYYALADVHLRMFPNRQTTVAHLRDYMGDLRRMQELRDQKDHSRLKRDRADDDVEEDERPRQRVKTQDLGQTQPAQSMHSQQHVQNGHVAYAYGRGPSQPANNEASRRFSQPQPRPPTNYQQHPHSGHGNSTHAGGPSLAAQEPTRYDGFDQIQRPVPNSSYKRPRADNDDDVHDEPHTPKRAKVSTPSAPFRQHKSRHERPDQPNMPGSRFHPNPQRAVNLPTLDNPFAVDPRFEIDPHLLNPALNTEPPPNAAPFYPFATPVYNSQNSPDPFQSDVDLAAFLDQNNHLPVPDSNANSSYPDPLALPGSNNHLLAPERGSSTQPAKTPTRYSDPSDLS